MKIAFVTGNPGKLKEARAALAGLAEVEQDTDGYPEIQADTLIEVARAGLDAVSRRRDPPFILEDAGLFIDTLGGFPGVYSAYVYRTIGCQGILRLLADTPDPERLARFEAVIAYRDESHNDHFFTGTVEGWIRYAESGDQGFGFDPVFTPQLLAPGPDGPSFAELSPEKKNELSHRGEAFAMFRRHLEQSSPATPAAHEKDS